MAYPSERRICLSGRPSRSGRMYVSALHEIGHCVLQHRGNDQRNKFKREVQAWAWALLRVKHVSLQFAMEYVTECLFTYCEDFLAAYDRIYGKNKQSRNAGDACKRRHPNNKNKQRG